MAFRTTPKPTFKQEVTVNIANDKGGYDRDSFVAIFKRASLDEQVELRKLSNEALLRSQLVNWEMTQKDTNEAVPFTSETLEEVMQITPTAYTTALAFWDGVNGAKTKNS